MSDSQSLQWQRELTEPLQAVVDRVSEYDGEDNLRDLLPEQLGVSGGENFSAEDHRGREILELLQNATDATADTRDSGDTRTIYLLVTEDGVIVANTGDNFDFEKSTVRNALRILGHSNKDTETIGEFGVGLTSIRAAGEGYEVWTKTSPSIDTESVDPQDCWRVRCGPENVLTAIAQYADTVAESEILTQMQCDVQGTDGVLSRGNNDTSIRFNLDLDEFPYFLYPLGLRNWKSLVSNSNTVSPLRGRAYQLLSGKSTEGCRLPTMPAEIQEKIPDLGDFTTAVFVDFENESLRSLFGALSESEPPAPDEHAHRLRDQAWFDERNDSEITPELLLNLGGIDRLVVEDRVTTTDDESKFQLWEIGSDVNSTDDGTHPTRVIEHGSDGKAIRGERIAVSLSEVTTKPETEQTRNDFEYPFWRFTYQDKWDPADVHWYAPPETDTEDVDIDDEIPDRVAVLVPATDPNTRYRPHLYYPIGNAGAAFPFCLHGDFSVQQNRQDLAADGIERNCAVAAGLAHLVGQAAEALVSSPEVDDEFARIVPWNLLPEISDGETDSPKAIAQSTETVSRNKPFDALRSAIYDELRQSKCFPVSSDSPPVSLVNGETMPLLHPDTDVFAGIAALYSLDEEYGTETALAVTAKGTDWSFVQPTVVRKACSWLADRQSENEKTDTKDPWADILNAYPTDQTSKTARFETLLSTNSDESDYQLSVEAWAGILKAWSTHCYSKDEPVLADLDGGIARRLLDGTMQLAAYSSDTEDPEPETLNEFLPRGHEEAPFLLPCRHPAVTSATDEALESSNSVQLVRLESHAVDATHNTRQVLRPESSTDGLTIPDETAFSIYVLTDSAFRDWGQSISDANWGTSRFTGPTDFYRSLLKDVAKRDSPVSLADIEYLATQYTEVDQSKAKELEAIEGSYHRQSFVDDLVNSMDQISETGKTRLDARRVKLHRSILDSNTPCHGYAVQFDDASLHEWTDLADDAIVPPTDPSIPGVPTLDLSETTLSEFSRDGETNLFISALSTLGVSVFPGIRVVTLYRDEASPSRTNSSWNPLSDDAWQTKRDRFQRTDELHCVLDTEVGTEYLRAISGPGFDPVDSANHTPNCPVRPFPDSDESRIDLQNKDVMIASWVWLSPDTVARLDASSVARLIHLGDGSLTDSVFQTGWSCNHAKGSSDSVDAYVPTVLSWQLRSIGGWEDVTEIEFVPARTGTDDQSRPWNSDAESWALSYAVLDSAADSDRQSRQKSTRFLPRVNPERSALSETALRRLGVKPVDDLNPTEASIRLNALLEANRDPSADGLLFDGATPRGWQALYGRLMSPIVDAVHTSEGVLTLDHFEFIDWLPVRGRRDGQPAWFAIDVEQVGDNTVYYDTEEQAWESRIPPAGTYLLERPDSEYASTDHFESFCELHHESAESARYPEIEGNVPTQDPPRDLTNSRDEQIKFGVLTAAPVQTDLEEAERKYDRIVETLRVTDGTNVSGSFGDRNWAVQPVNGSVGIELTEESVSNSNSQFRPVVAATTGGQEIEPADLAELFQALFRGGRIDSYRLALSGGRVEGVENVRHELIEESRRSLETDLEIAGELLGVRSLEREFDLPEKCEFSKVREEIAERLSAESSSDDEIEFRELSMSSLTAYVDRLQRAGNQNEREWVGRWLQREQASVSSSTLARELCPDRFESGISIPGWKRQLVSRLCRSTSERAYLPEESIGTVLRFARLVTGLQQSETIDDVDFLTVSGDIRWDNRIEFSLPAAKNESSIDVFEDVVPEHATWFHLAWEQAERDLPVVESREYTALRESLLSRISGETDGVKEELTEKLEQRVTGAIDEREYNPSSNDTELLNNVESDLSFDDIVGSIGQTTPENVHAAERNSASTYTGSSGDSPRVAELVVLKRVYQALTDSDISRTEAERDLAVLRNSNNYWHTNPGWNELDETRGSEYPSLDSLESLDNSFPGEALDTTDEPRVGYDILDPTSALIQSEDGPRPSLEEDKEVQLDPVPIEVKLVSSLDTPGFRFSINQFRRALSFISSDSGPHRTYIIMLVALDERDGLYKCEGYRSIILEEAADVYDLLSVDIGTDSLDESVVTHVIQDLVRSGHFIISG